LASLSLEPLVHADENWLRNREHQICRLFGRLASGVTIAQAQAEMTLLADRIRQLHDPNSQSARPATALVWPGSPFPLPLQAYPILTYAILFIMAAAGMVLAVACADVGSLQLARARSRQHGTPNAPGARGQPTAADQAIADGKRSAWPAGGCHGPPVHVYVVGNLARPLAAEAFPAEFGTLIFDVTPDLEIFAFRLCHFSACRHPFGLAPAMESSRTALFSTARGSTSPARSRRIQDFLLAAQVALSLVLMIAGSMLIRSSINSLKLETGYDTKHVVDLDLQFPEGPKYTAARKLALVQELRARLGGPARELLPSPAPGRRVITAFSQPPLRSMERNSRRRVCSRCTTLRPGQTTSRLLAFPCFWAAASHRKPASQSAPSSLANQPPDNCGRERAPSAAASV